MKQIKTSSCILVLLLMWVTDVWAQFNPDSPKEPSIQYKVVLESTPDNIAWLYGEGMYDDGSYANISVYCYNGAYVFDYWECDGEVYSRNSSFRYQISTHDVKFIAHYQFKPQSPDPPQAHFMRKIYLKSEPEGVGYYNINSGEKFELGTVVPIYETGRNVEYQFLGWYDGDELICSLAAFDFTVPDRDVTLVARYEFKPGNPAPPSSFYSESCEFWAESDDTVKGTVTVEGLEKGRAVYGSRLILRATPTGVNKFCGWFLGDSLMSVNPNYSFSVPNTYQRMHIVAAFRENPHYIRYKYDGRTLSTFVYDTGDSLDVYPDLIRDGYTFTGWLGVPAVMPDEDISVTGSFRLSEIRISQPSVELEGGDKQMMKVYAGSVSKEVIDDIIWTTSDEEVVTVSKRGVIKGISKGSAVITATVRSDSLLSVSALIDVISDNDKVDLPQVEFEFNYNAVNYDVENNRIENDLDARLGEYNLQMSDNIPVFIEGNRLSITDLCQGYIDRWSRGSIESGNYFSRTDDDSLTIICKVKPRFDNSSNKSDFIGVNATSNTNFSLRIGYKNAVYLGTRNAYTNRNLKYQDDSAQIFALRVRTGKVVIQNLTTGESKILETNSWGWTGGSMNIFYCDASNYFIGDFYWVYLSKEYLSESDIWDVVDYNEYLGNDSVPEVLMGDADNSGAVDVDDVTDVADYLFDNNPAIFNFKASDVNLSRELNVADIAGIVNLISGSPSTESVDSAVNGVMLDISQITPGSEGLLTVSVINAPGVSAVEMNIRLPEGLTVIDSEMDIERCGNRNLKSGYVDGAYKLIIYSLENEALIGTDGKLFAVRVKASENMEPSSYDISITDIVFSCNGDEYKIQSLYQSLIVEDASSQVSVPDYVTDKKAYDILGREVELNTIKNGPYIVREFINGKAIRTYKVVR